jgi:hypothetical protein
MPRNPMPMEDVVLWLASEYPTLEWEADRDWIWITTDLAPVHRKCECGECTRRAEIRKDISEIGFIFAPAGHELESGEVGYWSHSCETPTRFKRRDNGRKPDEPSTSTESVSDEELLAIL